MEGGPVAGGAGAYGVFDGAATDSAGSSSAVPLLGIPPQAGTHRNAIRDRP